MSVGAMSVAGSTLGYGDGPTDSYIPINGNVNSTYCRTRTGRSKRDRLRTLVQALLASKVYAYRSLNLGWRSTGSQFIETVSSSSGFPSIIDYPVFVFRLSAPNGNQSDFPTAATNTVVAPLIMFRLRSYQTSAGAALQFRWMSTNPYFNYSVSGSSSQTAFPNPQANAQVVVMEDSTTPFTDVRLKHEYSSIKLLYTNPIQLECTLECGVVKFTRDSYCPPDEYIDQAGGWTTVNATRGNSGAYDIGVPVLPDGPTSQEMADFWEHYLTPRTGHPLQVDTRFPTPRPVFHWVSNFKRSFSAQTSTNLETSGVQHQHDEVYRSGVWNNTAIPQNATLNSGFWDQTPARDAGVFPKPNAQRWFMVTAWTRNGVVAPATLSANTSPSFDIDIRSKFTCYTNRS